MGIMKLVKIAAVIGAGVVLVKVVKNSNTFKSAVEKAKEAAGL